jgi:hypothetical protein
VLASSTLAEYTRIARELREDFGNVLLSEVTSAWVSEARDIWARRGYKAANDRRQVLKNALAPAIADDRIKVDPFVKVLALDRPHDGRGTPDVGGRGGRGGNRTALAAEQPHDAIRAGSGHRAGALGRLPTRHGL